MKTVPHLSGMAPGWGDMSGESRRKVRDWGSPRGILDGTPSRERYIWNRYATYDKGHLTAGGSLVVQESGSGFECELPNSEGRLAVESSRHIILGNGSELRRVLSLIEADPHHECVGCIPWKGTDPSLDPADPGLGVHLWLGLVDHLEDLVATHRCSVVLGISSAEERWQALGTLFSLSIEPASLISADAHVDPHVNIGAGTVIHQSVIVEREVTMGKGCLLLPGSRMAVGSRCGDAVVLESGSQVLDMARVGDEVHLGTRSTVMDDRIVGPSSLILPGSIVTTDVEPNAIVSGTPATIQGEETSRDNSSDPAG